MVIATVGAARMLELSVLLSLLTGYSAEREH
jgi:hypothetical protein